MQELMRIIVQQYTAVINYWQNTRMKMTDRSSEITLNVVAY